MKKSWLSGRPTKCELCAQPFKNGDVFFDAKTKNGQWGLLCSNCFVQENGRLGTGLGQKYDLNTLEKLDG